MEDFTLEDKRKCPHCGHSDILFCPSCSHRMYESAKNKGIMPTDDQRAKIASILDDTLRKVNDLWSRGEMTEQKEFELQQEGKRELDKLGLHPDYMRTVMEKLEHYILD